MTEATSPPSIPPEILHYMKGATDESLQFGFLIGDWSIEGKRLTPNGETAQEYAGKWHAEYLHDKRMVMDDFTVYLPSGQPISSFVTLRTYSPFTQRWEMAGLAAFQPSTISKWYGNLIGGEMHLSAEGYAPNGSAIKTRIRFYDIKQSSFKWENLMSTDDGKTWLKTSSLIATRIPG